MWEKAISEDPCVICELKKGIGNYTELFRLVDIEEQWKECQGDLAVGGQQRGGYSLGHSAWEELDLWLNLAECWISCGLMGTEDLANKVSCSAQHGGEC